ncbi:hypothetical protein KAFR_0F03350 [Kazachstania africana CBS 2517]|uniref:Uncharacterized protein n=1 Tax=Kazachstania africana (strain ATCC 22294 / BCRC 22015 / CBS 2517 / CECT 1963 / NBRC 1671 / NRRL Y-8276) TaxID=1071382 RepID=H2AX31_KAZAF|nr:hypothetical protein KAFR_0F03350 [Kazachstania africana CBS 2517]CCF58931.1 hypothetical protein KAFR_0F03350 [Kazachstania africana CBS 2517]
MTEASKDQISNDDPLLNMFFDDGFVPQAFVDILLTNSNSEDTTQVQSTASSLLTRLDFYTKNLTAELESTIFNLEKLSEALPGTWVNPALNTDDTNDDQPMGTSKLEYYIDTLGSAVRALELDVAKVETQLGELKSHYTNSENIKVRLNKLHIVKKRLNIVLQYFIKLKNISNITDSTKRSDSNSNLTSISDFKISLQTLEETIDQSLLDLLENETVEKKEKDLLLKVRDFCELTILFKGLGEFYEAYSEFALNIQNKANDYMSRKNVENAFSI